MGRAVVAAKARRKRSSLRRERTAQAPVHDVGASMPSDLFTHECHTQPRRDQRNSRLDLVSPVRDVRRNAGIAIK